MQGSTMLTESLAQYTALMAMQRVDGHDQIRKFLKYELDAYLKSRGTEVMEELPLDRVENQPYIHYRKGALVMYRLADVIGQDRVDAALRADRSVPRPGRAGPGAAAVDHRSVRQDHDL
jgi:aminopeptidase N